MVFTKTIELLALDDAETVAKAILKEACTDPGNPIAVAVTSHDGGLIFFACMDNTALAPRGYAVRKAYTSARMGCETVTFADNVASHGLDVNVFRDPQLITFPGGVCMRSDTAVLGGIGVSGRESAEDVRLARIGLASLGLISG